MDRPLDAQSLIPLPILGGQTTYVLGESMVTAATAQGVFGDPPPAWCTIALTACANDVKVCVLSLGDALALEPVAQEVEPKVADQGSNATWGAVHGFLVSLDKLAAPYNPDPAGVRKVLDEAFKDGLAFLNLEFKRQYAEAQARLDLLAKDPFPAILARIDAGRYLKAVADAHEVYGRALGVTAPRAVVESPAVREAMTRLQEALREYVLRAAAVPCPALPGSKDAAAALLEPLATWE